MNSGENAYELLKKEIGNREKPSQPLTIRLWKIDDGEELGGIGRIKSFLGFDEYEKVTGKGDYIFRVSTEGFDSTEGYGVLILTPSSNKLRFFETKDDAKFHNLDFTFDTIKGVDESILLNEIKDYLDLVEINVWQSEPVDVKYKVDGEERSEEFCPDIFSFRYVAVDLGNPFSQGEDCKGYEI